MIDLDSNATTPLLPEVLDYMLPWLREGYANPSGTYKAAKLARQAIEHAREQVATLIGAQPEEIIFTGCGTESVNTALYSLHALAGEGNAIISAIEHSAVMRCVESIQREKRLVKVNSGGLLDLEDFSAALNGAAFTSIMTANNETGVIQPIKEAAALAHEKGIPFHTDAIQAAGKMQLHVKEIGADLLSLSAHKFYGPKGVGALYVRSGLRFEPLLKGGGQESGRRSGTENTAGIVGMGMAAELSMRHLAETATLTELSRDIFEKQVLAEIPGVFANGDPSHRLSNTSHLSFEHCDAAGLLILLDEAGLSCSAGSACMAGKQRPSHVQLAMGISEIRAKSSLRFSFSRFHTPADALAAAEILKKAVEKLRRAQGPDVGPVVVYGR